jgi:hypothetical protein
MQRESNGYVKQQAIPRSGSSRGGEDHCHRLFCGILGGSIGDALRL